MTIILDIVSARLIHDLVTHGFIVTPTEHTIEITIEPYNPIELQRLGLVLEQYE